MIPFSELSFLRAKATGNSSEFREKQVPDGLKPFGMTSGLDLRVTKVTIRAGIRIVESPLCRSKVLLPRPMAPFGWKMS